MSTDPSAQAAPQTASTYKLLGCEGGDAPDGSTKVVLGVPHTDYQLHLSCETPINVSVGKRIKGAIEAVALRVHPSDGGGRFIEPLWGAPRIVAGLVQHVDAPNRRVLVDCAVPVWITTPEQQDFSVIREGELVNFYVESGARFVSGDAS